MQRLGFAPEEVIAVVQGLVVLFIAAPRIIEYLAKTFQDEGKRAKKDPTEAAPYFLGASVALAGTVFSIAAATLINQNAMLLWIALLGAIVGVFAFTKFLVRDYSGVNAIIVEAVIWFIVSAAGMMMAPMSVVLLFGALGILSIVAGIIVRRKMRQESALIRGGEV
jgi:hypothetical protein